MCAHSKDVLQLVKNTLLLYIEYQFMKTYHLSITKSIYWKTVILYDSPDRLYSARSKSSLSRWCQIWTEKKYFRIWKFLQSPSWKCNTNNNSNKLMLNNYMESYYLIKQI